MGSTPRFTVRYFVGPTNVTSPVLAGTYTTPELAPGQTSTLRVQVTVKPTAPRGPTLTAQSPLGPSPTRSGRPSRP